MNNYLNYVKRFYIIQRTWNSLIIRGLSYQMAGKPVSVPKEIADLLDYTDEICIKFSTNLDGMLTYSELENLLNESSNRK